MHAHKELIYVCMYVCVCIGNFFLLRTAKHLCPFILETARTESLLRNSHLVTKFYTGPPTLDGFRRATKCHTKILLD